MMVKHAHHPAGLNEQRLGESKEEDLEQPDRARGREGSSSEASPHLSSWKELNVSEAKSKMKKNNLFPFPIQEIAEGIYISLGDLEYKR